MAISHNLIVVQVNDNLLQNSFKPEKNLPHSAPICQGGIISGKIFNFLRVFIVLEYRVLF